MMQEQRLVMQEQRLAPIFERPASFQGTDQQYTRHVFKIADDIYEGRTPDTTGIPHSHVHNAMQRRFGGQ